MPAAWRYASHEILSGSHWFRGRENIGRFLAAWVLTSPGAFTLIATAVNGQPALAICRRAEDGTRRAYAVQVLTLRECRCRED